MKQGAPARRLCLCLLAGLAALRPAAGAEALAPVQISGKRASAESAQEIRRERVEIVDAVVAETVQKLPDFSVTDALQRVTGVQIARDRGDGSGVAVRGLTQIETTLNGREVFTAGTGRSLDLADLPAETVAGIDVYKTGAASQIEGGVGGAIDLRTRRPFDFAGARLAGSVREVRDGLAQGTRRQWSLLASQRWQVGDGAAGALLTLAQQPRAFREDQNSLGGWRARSDLVTGRSVLAPALVTQSSSQGERERSSAGLTLQWRPSAALELYGEGNYASFRTRQDTYQVNAGGGGDFVAGTPRLSPGTADLQAITWRQAPVSILSFARDTVDRDRLLAVGAQWRTDSLTVKADLSHSDSVNVLYFAGLTLAGTAPTLAQDLAPPSPSAQVADDALSDPARLRLASMAYRYRRYAGALDAVRLDATLPLAGAWFDRLQVGARLARRDADNGAGLVVGDTALGALPAAAHPELLTPYPGGRFFPGAAGPMLDNYLAGSLALARDAAALRRAVGIAAPLPTSGDPLGLWRLRERTDAAYAQLRLAPADDGALDGEAGLRAVRTSTSLQGMQSAPAAGATAPIAAEHAYTDYLPSINLRYRLAQGWQWRGAASKTMTRPNFDQLSPSLTLVPNSITPAANAGSAGNPALRPVRSTNLDLALERYFGPASALSATIFRKRVDGLVGTLTAAEVHDGLLYQVSRPYNNAGATLDGVELALQHFPDDLPAPLRGLGVQANVTLIDSATPSTLLGADIPLPNLSRRSANLVLIYDGGPLSARLAYNWRDRFLSSVTTLAGVGALPIYTRGYGWLDASLAWRCSPHLTVSLDGNNLLGTVRRAYYDVPTRPQSAWQNDRQLSLAAQLLF